MNVNQVEREIQEGEELMKQHPESAAVIQERLIPLRARLIELLDQGQFPDAWLGAMASR
jgi:hypothetical protein